MNEAQTSEIAGRILAFDIDGEPLETSFGERLARENHWTRAFAERVVAEYKRFLVLAACTGHPVTPSNEVDQAWHLHLVYTRSYWDRLCGEVLGFPLHHGPTKGGAAEDVKYHGWYADTLSAYERFFGERPPADIWPCPELRFLPRSERRLDLTKYWILPKWFFRQPLVAASLLCLLAAAGFGCVAAFDEKDELQLRLLDRWALSGAQAYPILGGIGVVIAAIAVFLIVAVNRAGHRHGPGDGGGGSGCSGIAGCGHHLGPGDGSGCGADGGGGGGGGGCSGGGGGD